jgi:NDP-sugar pyrophosphorylase family protein
LSRIGRGAILAAGEGSRLRREGSLVPKPLVPIAGVPLIGHAIGNLAAAGVEELVVIFNGEEQDCAAWVAERFPDLSIRVLISTTASSLESFREVQRLAGPGPILVTTVDAFCAPEDFQAFARAAAALPEQTTALAVTRFVDDERPLWVSAAEDGRVRAIGEGSGDFVTAGFYVFSERARRLAGPPPQLDRLRDFLAWLHASGEPITAIEVGTVIDVDRAVDIEAAERLASSITRSPDHPITRFGAVSAQRHLP